MHFFKILISRLLDSSISGHGLVFFVYTFFVKSCMTVSIWLYNEFSSRNLIMKEGNDAMVQILTLPFICYKKCPLPWSCDQFHRQKTFCTRDSLPHSFLIFDFVFFTVLSFCLIP